MLAEIKMQHGSPAEAKPFLEVARVRADQAEISAGFSGLNTEDSGAFLVQSHKSCVRIYGLIKDFVQRDTPSGRFTYFGRETEVLKDTVASVGDWIILKTAVDRLLPLAEPDERSEFRTRTPSPFG